MQIPSRPLVVVQNVYNNRDFMRRKEYYLGYPVLTLLLMQIQCIYHDSERCCCEKNTYTPGNAYSGGSHPILLASSENIRKYIALPIASRLEDIARRTEAIASRLEATAKRVEAIASSLCFSILH